MCKFHSFFCLACIFSATSIIAYMDLVKIKIESPEKFSDSDLENIVDVWNSSVML